MPVDATDRLLLAESAPAIAAAGPGHVVVVDDRFGALTLAAAALLGATAAPRASDAGPLVRVQQDEVTDTARLEAATRACGMDGAYAHFPHLDADLLRGARVVLLVLPRSLAALREIAELVATHAAPDVTVYAGGRVKHMTPAMNDVLRESFGDVRASLARGKSRLLVATGARPPRTLTYPVTAATDIGPVVAHGAVFAGAGLDLGTRALVAALDARREPRTGDYLAGTGPVREVVDLGCGTGLLAAWAARHWPDAHVWATDRSIAAVSSAGPTAHAWGVGDRVEVLLADAGAGIPDASVDVVLCNPPFHDGPAVGTHTAHRMFASAARVLRPGGELWCVWNSHLRYRPALERVVGPTSQATRDRRFTVTVSRRR